MRPLKKHIIQILRTQNVTPILAMKHTQYFVKRYPLTTSEKPTELKNSRPQRAKKYAHLAFHQRIRFPAYLSLGM